MLLPFGVEGVVTLCCCGKNPGNAYPIWWLFGGRGWQNLVIGIIYIGFMFKHV